MFLVDVWREVEMIFVEAGEGDWAFAFLGVELAV